MELLQSTNNLPKSRFEGYERMVPAFSQRKTQPKISHNDSLNYQFVVFDTETISLGKQAQICQLAAMTKDGKTYNEYVLPTCNISSYASCANKLTVKTVNDERTLLKENVPVHSVPLSECLQSFTTFLSSSTHCHTVLIGHNSSVFNTLTLLRCAGNSYKETLLSKNVFFPDSPPLVKTIAKGGNALLNPDGKPCKSNLPSVYQVVCHEDFNAHDALEDVCALHGVLFQCPLQLTSADIVNNSNVKSTSFAFKDMEFLDRRHKRMQTFKDKLLVKQNIIQKIAEGGLFYDDLKDLYNNGGKEALNAILSNSPTTPRQSVLRGKKHPDTLHKIIQHFEGK